MSKTVFGLVKVNNILLNFLFTAFKNSMKTFLLAPKTFLKNHKIHNTVYKKPHEDCHACADAACRVSLQHKEEGRVHKTVDKSHVEVVTYAQKLNLLYPTCAVCSTRKRAGFPKLWTKASWRLSRMRRCHIYCIPPVQHKEEGRVHKTVDKSNMEGHLVGHGLLRLNSRRKSSKWIPVMMQYV